MAVEFILRFLAGGMAVTCFAVTGDILRPKSFAGLLGAAPSVAIATLAITISRKDAVYASAEAWSMMAGAAGFLAYAFTVMWVMHKYQLSSLLASICLLPVWFLTSWGAWALMQDYI